MQIIEGMVFLPNILTLLLTACSSEEPPIRLVYEDAPKQPQKPPLDIQFPLVTRTIYPGNTIYPMVEECMDSYGDSDRNSISSDQFDQCLHNKHGVHLAHTGIEDMLCELRRRTAFIAFETDEELLEIETAFNEVPGVELKARSTDGLLSEFIKWSNDGSYHSFDDTPSELSLIQYYAQVYGVELIMSSQDREDIFWLLPTSYLSSSHFDPEKDPPPMFMTVELVGGVEQATYYQPNNKLEIVSYSPEEIHWIKSFAQHFEEELTKTVDILYRHHPNIHRENLESVVYVRLAATLAAIREEDPWQDAGAAAVVQSTLAYSTTALPENAGLKIFGNIFHPDWETAAIASDMSRQGYGIMQVIASVAFEAAQDQDVLSHWDDVLSPEEFATMEDTVRTCLDKNIYSFGLCLDFALTKLEQTIFSNPAVRTPRTNIIMMHNKNDAHENSLLNAALNLTAYPEQDRILKRNLVSQSDPLIRHFWAHMFGIQLHPHVHEFISGPFATSDLNQDGAADSIMYYYAMGDLGSREALREFVQSQSEQKPNP